MKGHPVQMKKAFAKAAVTGGIGLAALGIGTGAATATTSATPTHVTSRQVSAPAAPALGAVKRPDLRSFEYRGQQVTPTFDERKQGWGFWFFGLWVPVVL